MRALKFASIFAGVFGILILSRTLISLEMIMQGQQVVTELPETFFSSCLTLKGGPKISEFCFLFQ